MTFAIVLLAVGAAALTYFGIERLGRRAWLPFLCRSFAWAGLGILLINLSCPAPGGTESPVILLDGSLSMRSDSARFSQLADSLATVGELLYFGDARPATDPVVRGRSQLRTTLQGALGMGRTVEIVSDGQLDDGAELPRGLMADVGVHLLPGNGGPTLAVTRVRGPDRLTAGDSLVVTGEVRAVGGWTGGEIDLELRLDDRALAGTTVLPGPGGRVGFRLESPATLPAGEHLLTVAVTPSDSSSTNTGLRLLHLIVVPTPGVVLLADPGDWDARFLYRALKDVADLPVKGYVTVTGDQWRSMEDLEAVTSVEVRRAARGADLLVLKGGTEAFARDSRARAIWRWASGENGEAQLAGDWYLALGPGSPLAPALAGVAVDSFPPASQITPIQAEDGEWVGLLAQEGRRGALRPVVIGGERGRSRYVTVAADGLWRWAFPGGSSEQGYRAWVAATTSWLLGGVDSTTAPARPINPVVQRARPLQFRWTGSGPPMPLPIRLQSADSTVTDTLSFDGSGTATIWLPLGRYRYTLPNGTGGVVAVEPYSDELLPRAITLQPQASRAAAHAGRTSAREALWLFGLVVLALAGEWLARRHMGLR